MVLTTTSYSARLPVLCTAISLKLGGPAAVTPGRPKLVKSMSTSAKVHTRPGAITKRPVPSKSKSLQRALTSERHKRSDSRGPSGAIALMRSATVPLVPGLKREPSETPSLSSIQSTGPPTMQVSRGGVLKSRKFSARQIDFTSLGTSSEPKTKKTREADIDVELADVISAMRKPNRQLAGQSIMETVERRTLGQVRARSRISATSTLSCFCFTDNRQKVQSRFAIHCFKAFKSRRLPGFSGRRTC